MAMTKKQKETLKEYVQKLEGLSSMTDKEGLHVTADDLLLQALRDLGITELADAYTTLETKVGGFWYA